MIAPPVADRYAPTCFRTRKHFEERQASFDIDQLLRELIKPGEAVSKLSDEQAYKFVAEFFEDSLLVLRQTDRTPSEQREVLDWMFEGPVAVLIDGRNVIEVPTKRLRFSFRWCCSLFGYDPERFQQATIDALFQREGYTDSHRAVHETFRQKLIILERENLWSIMNAN